MPKKFLLLVISLFWVSAFSLSNQQPLVNKPVHRIISLAPNVTELLFAAGVGAKVVGISAFSDYPPQALKLPIVATSGGLDMERIIALQPDLVVAWQGGNSPEELESLANFHIPVVNTRIQTIAQLIITIKYLGNLAGTSKEANQTANQLNNQYKTLLQQYSKQPVISVFYQISTTPLLTLNDNNLIDEIIRGCGGHNIFAHTLGQAPEVNITAVLANQPQVIIISESPASQVAAKQFWQQYPELQAVQVNNVFLVNPDFTDRAGPRMILGMQQICKDIAIARQHLKNSAKLN
ncbi:MAG: hypothetical protein A3E87_00985 [Gammaproteobacteria bacterium RIFCSPHIGHO2_12_FULL_35_23]|nr:MAG: hypothetical protein A3E87_00985 [Gammaproteobacteria bacterium RIFCSPHIGHO2_12_FULL_35_23]